MGQIRSMYSEQGFLYPPPGVCFLPDCIFGFGSRHLGLGENPPMLAIPGAGNAKGYTDKEPDGGQYH
jgi:hypothetical protein